MCAIAGIFQLKADEEICGRLLATMTCRGPDGNGIYRGKEGVLLHSRLSVIEPADGQRPMELAFAGEKYSITYNGELYNARELRRELLALGHSFRGHTDTEVLLHAYAQWKEGCLERLNGVYAFAILEEGSGRVFLARDRIGVKPFFYTEHCGGLLFASEIKTILAYPTMDACLDAQGAGEVLLLGPGRTPGSGVFRGIRELEPGCCGFWDTGRLTLRRYWKLQDRPHTDSFPETVEKVRALVLDAIRRQMVSDVPIGTFLSGGLDSSLISSVCSREVPGLKTFSVDYLDNDKYFQAGLFQPNSDPAYIRVMQEYLQSDHHWTVLSPEELMADLEETTIARDLPGMADVDISLRLFCKNVRPHVKVALSGECADEIFGGYPWYRDPDIRNFNGFPWAQTTRERMEFLQPWISEKIAPEAFVYDRYCRTIVQSDILPDTDPLNKRIKELVNLNFRWFMQTLIDRTDRMSSSCGLTVRVPLCDYRIAEYLYAVPWEMKNRGGREKGLLREAMRGFLPEQILQRKKSPYPKTHHPRYLALAEERLRQLLQETDAPIFQLVPRKSLESLLQEDFPWPWYGQLMRRPQTIVYMLQINFWLKHYSVRIV